LLAPGLIARVAGAPEEWTRATLQRIVSEMEDYVFARTQDVRLRREVAANRHAVSVIEDFRKEFKRTWSDTALRISLCPAKKVLHGLNEELTLAGHKPVSAQRLARAMRPEEVPDEMKTQLLYVEQMINKHSPPAEVA
jgi:hypothetical protein